MRPPLAQGSGGEARIPHLDGLRGLALAAVFVHHAFHAPLLWAGVNLFFVLSGFLITGVSCGRRGRRSKASSSFYLRRALRILPPLIMALLMIQLMLGVAWKTDWPWLAFFATNIASLWAR